jgi:hypothetical protein
MPLKYDTIQTAALPDDTWRCLCIPDHFASFVPASSPVFQPVNCLEGRNEPVIGLKRHPLIIRFSPENPLRVNTPLAGRNLHLVTLWQFTRLSRWISAIRLVKLSSADDSECNIFSTTRSRGCFNHLLLNFLACRELLDHLNICTIINHTTSVDN